MSSQKLAFKKPLPPVRKPKIQDKPELTLTTPSICYFLSGLPPPHPPTKIFNKNNLPPKKKPLNSKPIQLPPLPSLPPLPTQNNIPLPLRPLPILPSRPLPNPPTYKPYSINSESDSDDISDDDIIESIIIKPSKLFILANTIDNFNIPIKQPPTIDEFYSRKSRKSFLQKRPLPHLPQTIKIYLIIFGKIIKFEIDIILDKLLTTLITKIESKINTNENIINLIINNLEKLPSLSSISTTSTSNINELYNNDKYYLQQPILIYNQYLINNFNKYTFNNIGIEYNNDKYYTIYIISNYLINNIDNDIGLNTFSDDISHGNDKSRSVSLSDGIYNSNSLTMRVRRLSETFISGIIGYDMNRDNMGSGYDQEETNICEYLKNCLMLFGCKVNYQDNITSLIVMIKELVKSTTHHVF